MEIKMSYDQNFVKLINGLKGKYPEELFKIDGISDDQLDIAKFSKKFMESDNTSNASIDANGNVSEINIVTYNKEVNKPITKLNGYFLMWKQLKNTFDLTTANTAVESAINGDIYVHDSTNFNLPYCFNYTAYDIVLNGLPSWTGIGVKTAPKTLLAYTEQVKNFLINAGSQQMGATGVADFLVFASYFIERNLRGIHVEGGLNKDDFAGREELFEQRVWEDAKQTLTTWIYNINDNYRADQTLFTNVSLYDRYFLENLLSEINMTEAPYQLDIEIVIKTQELFVDIMNDELQRTPLTYPVTTASFSRYDEKDITITFDDDTTEKYDQFSKVNKKYGIVDKSVLAETIVEGDVVDRRTVKSIDIVVGEKNILRDKDFVRYIAKENLPYQFINMFNGESSVLSSCCRLRSNMNEFENEKFGSIGGSGSAKIGSIGVGTINLPRVAFKLKNGTVTSLEDEIRRLTELTIKINYARRMLITDKINRGMLPVYTDGYMILNRQFSTTGVIGGYEFSKIMGNTVLEQSGIDDQLTILKTIRETQDALRKDDMYKDVPFNVEQIPGESTSSKLASKDVVMGLNTIGLKLYANQFIPLQERSNLFDRIRIAGIIDSSDYLNGGSILHINADSRIDSIEKMEDMIHMVAKAGVSYWAINFDLIYCTDCNTFEIKTDNSGECKSCGSENVASYIRVVGFLTKVESWSDVKQLEDYNKRQMYKGIEFNK